VILFVGRLIGVNVNNCPILMHKTYRPDIDGLRAVAILSVVMFHASPNSMPGGFIGVDIFFVISGYLISKVLFEAFSQESFSLTDFYIRRIRRIFPALITVLMFVYVAGWVVLLADEYRQLGKHIAAGAGFISNLALWSEAGYFDNTAESKPLLHLWSLGIEEQFYLIWPLLLSGMWKKRRRPLLLISMLIVVLFLLNLWWVKKDAVAAFYAPYFRFWELLFGSMLAWLSVSKKKVSDEASNHMKARWWPKSEESQRWCAHLMSWLGALLLVYGFYRINKNLAFPGKWALIPVLGAVLIIAAGPKAYFNRVVLSSRLAIWFGLISFPLYLWHWPVLSFARILAGDVPSREIRLGAVLLAVLLAWLTYRLIELPLRFGKFKTHQGLVLCMLLMGGVGGGTYLLDGLPSRSVAERNVSPRSGEAGGPGDTLLAECGLPPAQAVLFANCVKDRRGPSRYALLGDSKAAALFPGLVRTSTEAGRWVFIGGAKAGGAPVPVVSTAPLYQRYQALSTPAIKAVADNSEVETVVLVAAARALFQLVSDSDLEALPASPHAPIVLDGLSNTIQLLRKAGKKVVLVVDNPTLPHPEDCLARTTDLKILNDLFGVDVPAKCTVSIERQRQLAAPYLQVLMQLRTTYPDVRVFDMTEYLCDMNLGVCRHQKEGLFLYSYSDHISDAASGVVGEKLNAFLEAKP
jgi:peptidoglycan/LPS O-acetylase OafA/YrhL